MDLKSLKRIAHGVTANVVAQIVIAVTQLTIVPILATHWGVELYGWWILVSTIPSYLALGDLGFATAAGAEMTMQIARGDRAAAVITFQTAWTAVAILSSALLIVALILVWCLPDSIISAPIGLTSTAARTVVSLLILHAIVSLHRTIFLAGFRGISQYALGVYSEAWIFLAEGAAVFLLGLTNYSPVVVAFALLACRSFGASVQGILLSRKARWLTFRFTWFSRSEARHLFKPSAAVLALTAGQITFLQGTVMAVGAASSTSTAATFSSVRTLTRVGVQLTGLVTRALAPEYSVFSAQLRRRAQARIVFASLALSTALLLPLALVLAVFGEQIIGWWTRGMLHAEWHFIWTMTAVMVIHGLWIPLSNLLLAVNRQEELAYKYLAFSTGSVGLAYLLGRWYGELGGALSLLVLDTATASVVFRLTFRFLATPTEIWDVVRADLRLVYDGSRIVVNRLVSSARK
jgi:O-antigen/teichoic acid export membrane protein